MLDPSLASWDTPWPGVSVSASLTQDNSQCVYSSIWHTVGTQKILAEWMYASTQPFELDSLSVPTHCSAHSRYLINACWRLSIWDLSQQSWTLYVHTFISIPPSQVFIEQQSSLPRAGNSRFREVTEFSKAAQQLVPRDSCAGDLPPRSEPFLFHVKEAWISHEPSFILGVSLLLRGTLEVKTPLKSWRILRKRFPEKMQTV